MKLINLKSSTKREELVELIRNHELVNERVKFDELLDEAYASMYTETKLIFENYR